MRRWLHGMDEMALETAFIGVSALVFIVVAATALNSSAARSLEGAPVIGTVLRGARSLVGQVANS